MTRDRKQCDFETKLEILRRHVQGVSARALTKEYDIPSPGTVVNCHRPVQPLADGIFLFGVDAPPSSGQAW